MLTCFSTHQYCFWQSNAIQQEWASYWSTGLKQQTLYGLFRLLTYGLFQGFSCLLSCWELLWKSILPLLWDNISVIHCPSVCLSISLSLCLSVCLSVYHVLISDCASSVTVGVRAGFERLITDDKVSSTKWHRWLGCSSGLLHDVTRWLPMADCAQGGHRPYSIRQLDGKCPQF